MHPFLSSLAFVVGLNLVALFADALIKHAALLEKFSGWKFLLVGSVIYGLTGIGWFFLMRKMKLSTLGAFYSVSSVLFLTLLGVFYFKEKLSIVEFFGISMAVFSMVILSKFS